MINILYCDYCSWKKLSSDLDKLDILEIKQSDEKIRKFRCPSCGRLIRARKALDPQYEVDLKKRKENQKEELKAWTEDVLKYREEFNDE